MADEDFMCQEDAISRNDIFDFFLFINPLDPASFQAEKEILKFIKGASANIHFRMIPHHNLLSLVTFMRQQGMNPCCASLRNDLCLDLYQVSVAYKAALFYGQRRARAYLMEVQKALLIHQEKLSEGLLLQSARQVGFDPQHFLEDCRSLTVKEAYEEDQILGAQWGITQVPSLVICHNYTDEYGMLIDKCITEKSLQEICRSYRTTQNSTSQKESIEKNNLTFNGNTPAKTSKPQALFKKKNKGKILHFPQCP